jgi:hypothetical protein
MNKTYFLCVALLLQVGCSNREVLLESGLYQADSTAGVLGLLSGVSSDVIDGFQLAIDVGALTATPFADQETSIPLDLVEMDTEEWQVGCPTPMVTVYNQTFQFSADFSIGEVDLEGALLFASGCFTKNGAAVQEAWLSTEAYQETVDVVGGMTGMLKLVKVED